MLLQNNTLLPKEEQDGLGTSEGYMVITDEDIIEGVAAFIAKLLSTIPQSKVSMSKSRPPPHGHFWSSMNHPSMHRWLLNSCNHLKDLFISVT